MTNIVKYTTDYATNIDSEVRQLMQLYSVTRIKIGMSMAEKLNDIESNKLYLKLDSQAYSSFQRYLDSIGISYKVARDLISLYKCFILVAGMSVEELAKIPYYKLNILKPILFNKQDGKYTSTKNKDEIDQWISNAKSDLSLEDLKLLKREEEVGPHDHEWETITFNKCLKCGLKEYKGKK